MAAPEHLLAGCDEAQRAAITAAEAPLFVAAGAGSGKTRVLTRRVAWRLAAGSAQPSHALVVTFTRRAAGELRDRLGALGAEHPVSVGTFHALALRELRALSADRGQRPPAVVGNRTRLLRAAVEAVTPGATRGEAAATSDSLAGEIDWARARLLSPARYAEAARAAGRHPLPSIAAIAQCYEAYEQLKRRRGVLDLDDLLSRLTAELRADADFRAAQQWRFRHFFLDELQDLTAAQLELLGEWIGERVDLFAVGDAEQAIYGWNGALEGALGALLRRFPAARVIELEANYRSSPQLVAFSSALLAGRASSVVSCGEEGPLPTVTGYANEEDEATGVASGAKAALRRGSRPGEVAVLVRTNVQLRTLETAFDAAGVPRARGVRAALAQPPAAAALKTLFSCRDEAELVAERDGLVANDQARHGRAGADGGRSDPLLVALLEDYLALDPRPTGAGLGEYLRDLAGAEPAPGQQDAVELLTFHRAKGLEWPIVYVAGLEDGLVPIAHARGAAQRAEEQRLLYVALTRAQRELHCSWSATRNFRGAASARLRSPLLDGPLAALREARAGSDTDPAERALAESRAVLGRRSSTASSLRRSPT